MLDDIDCGLADRFEDCIHRGWGVHNCGSYESVGVVCNPGPSGSLWYYDYEKASILHNACFWKQTCIHADKLFLIHCLSTGNLSCELLPMQIMSCSEKRDAGVERLRQKSYQRYLFPSFFIIYTI